MANLTVIRKRDPNKPINIMLTIRQPFFVKDGGMFMSATAATHMFKDSDPHYGKQNRRRGTKHKKLRKIAKASRRRNRKVTHKS